MTDTLLEDYFQRAVANGMGLKFAAQCVGEIARREAQGRSFDCDEFRALQHWAFYADEGKPT